MATCDFGEVGERKYPQKPVLIPIILYDSHVTKFEWQPMILDSSVHFPLLPVLIAVR